MSIKIDINNLKGINLFNADCIDIMKQLPDKWADLAIVDPPYGIDITKHPMGGRNTIKPDKTKTWDKQIPNKIYFDELFRISKNQIIWGGNFFNLPPCICCLGWDKGETIYGRSFAEFEFAWTSLNPPSRLFKHNPNQLDRIHPTQKPIQLYKWLLKNYAKPEFKIIDTHGGSMSSVIACIDFDIAEMVCCELDKDYFEAGKKRVLNHVAQLNMYVKKPEIIFS